MKTEVKLEVKKERTAAKRLSFLGKVLGKKKTKDIAPPPPPPQAGDSDDDPDLAYQMEWAKQDFFAEQVRL